MFRKEGLPFTKDSATLLPLPGLSPSCIMLRHRRVENIHVSHCTPPSALKNPPKKWRGKKKEPESTEIKIGKKLKVFISNLEYLKHHSLLPLLVNEGTGKVSCLCQKMETWQVLWPAGPETAETTWAQGLIQQPILPHLSKNTQPLMDMNFFLTGIPPTNTKQMPTMTPVICSEQQDFVKSSLMHHETTIFSQEQSSSSFLRLFPPTTKPTHTPSCGYNLLTQFESYCKKLGCIHRSPATLVVAGKYEWAAHGPTTNPGILGKNSRCSVESRKNKSSKFYIKVKI